MKIKVNPIDETITIKRLSVEEFQLITHLITHVRLGAGDVFREAAFEFQQACDRSRDELDQLDIDIDNAPIDLHVTCEEINCDYATVEIYSPIFEVTSI